MYISACISATYGEMLENTHMRHVNLMLHKHIVSLSDISGKLPTVCMKTAVFYLLQISIICQSLTQHLYYIQWYICQGDMFRHSRSSSDPSRAQIQALLNY